MKPGEAFRMAASSLWSHKGRTILTVLGVVIGIASVIAVVSLSAAFEQSITSQFEGLDDRSVLVFAGTGNEQGPPDPGPFGLIFTEVDRQALLAIPGVEEVAASGQVPVTGLSVAGRGIPFDRLEATTPKAGDVREADGYLSGGVFAEGEREVVLGYAIATILGNGTPIEAGAAITIETGNGTLTATVAGVLKEQSNLFGAANRAVYVPLDPFYDQMRTSPTTGQATRVYASFTVFATDVGVVDDVRDRVEDALADSDASRLLTGDTQILVATPSEITAQIGAAFDQVTIFIAAIAGVSLLVAGVMIATIQLVTVTERTGEIGILKAIGARDRDVLGIFLTEAALIGAVGGLVGIGLGLAAGVGLVEGLFGSEDVSFVVPWDWIVFALLFGLVVGVIAGFLPARRATKVDPVRALTHE